MNEIPSATFPGEDVWVRSQQFTWGLVCFVVMLVVWTSQTISPSMVGAQELSQVQEPSQVQGERAFRYLKSVCEIGPRISGQPGMVKQQGALKSTSKTWEQKARFNISP